MASPSPCARISAALVFASLLAGCQPSSRLETSGKKASVTEYRYPPRPAVVPPPVKLFHQDNDTLTLTTKSDVTEDEIAAILWQFRDAAHDRTFGTLDLPQAFIDARKPIVWFHVYRGSKCATEKYTKGPLPCEASYHGAGDFTLGDYKNPQWNDGVLRHADGTEARLWNPDVPYSAPRP